MANDGKPIYVSIHDCKSIVHMRLSDFQGYRHRYAVHVVLVFYDCSQQGGNNRLTG